MDLEICPSRAAHPATNLWIRIRGWTRPLRLKFHVWRSFTTFEKVKRSFHERISRVKIRPAEAINGNYAMSNKDFVHRLMLQETASNSTAASCQQSFVCKVFTVFTTNCFHSWNLFIEDDATISQLSPFCSIQKIAYDMHFSANIFCFESCFTTPTNRYVTFWWHCQKNIFLFLFLTIQVSCFFILSQDLNPSDVSFI